MDPLNACHSIHVLRKKLHCLLNIKTAEIDYTNIYIIIYLEKGINVKLCIIINQTRSVLIYILVIFFQLSN